MVHGVPSYTMYHSISLIYHGIHHGMVYHGSPWCTMVHRGIPWCTMVYHCTPWYNHMVTHRGCTATCYDIVVKWYTMVHTAVYHKLPWYTKVYHVTTVMCYDTVAPWYTMVYTMHHGIPWIIMVYHGAPWYTTVRPECVMTQSFTIVYIPCLQHI